MVMHRGESCRILLVSPISLFGVELLEGWSLQQNERRDCWLCQLVHCILNETMDGQSILSLISFLDRVRSGWFDVIFLLPAAATSSRARHIGDGQHPLRSRAEPFGLQCLDPLSSSKVTASNQQLEFAFLLPQKKVGVVLVFAEDLGGSRDSGPTLIWALQEFRSLEGLQGGLRGVEYLRQIVNLTT